MKKVIIIFGTRPEAIKMAPVVKALKGSSKIDVKVLVTAQHREMLDQVLNFFDIDTNYDLDLMKKGQTLSDITSKVLNGVEIILKNEQPDLVLVHGDTTTSMAASLASYYQKIPVGHVEAGLRTGNIYSPFPEEMNRKITGTIASIHFAPTEKAKDNLINEGVPETKIVVTGNTVIDALKDGLEIIKTSNKSFSIDNLLNKINDHKIILVTGHRRENFGQGFLNICDALIEITKKCENVEIIYPVHLNPNVQEPVYKLLSKNDRIHLIDPLDYEEFIYLMNHSFIILTDSGGIQEEAPSLGKPVLVMREVTERPEAVESGTVKLVGTNKDNIISECLLLLEDKQYYANMSKAHNPYGDGFASEKILNHILE
ncbi:MAG: UDP-N-acetylglucosamine 2-epimerase (non-hydrolyzing) [Planctomycetota bacterium]|nr:MAG: UDP-N-acetylglucosamine 2-epimerase (non-hydrolyzing) [Planctomycetota bacterium]